MGRVFLTVLPLLGLGFFCGPILELASSWQARVPGGTLGLGVATLLSGVLALTWLEQLSVSEAIHLCVITGEWRPKQRFFGPKDRERRCLLALTLISMQSPFLFFPRTKTRKLTNSSDYCRLRRFGPFVGCRSPLSGIVRDRCLQRNGWFLGELLTTDVLSYLVQRAIPMIRVLVSIPIKK